MTDQDTGSTSTDPTAVFEEHRSVLLGVAYRMTGRVADAEDVVQEAWLRWAAADREDVRSPRAFLVRVTTRLAIDRLRQDQARREAYVGPWLPELLPTDLAGPAAQPEAETADSAERVVLTESVSLAVLVVLESLSPLERAVFVLREAFGFPYAEIAAALDRGEAAVRQLAGRARRHVEERRPRFEVDPEQQRDLTQRFLDAASGGDFEGLVSLLAPDVRLVGDSGGKAKAPLRIMTTTDKIGRFFAAVGRKAAEYEYSDQEFNGAPTALAWRAGRIEYAFQLDVSDGLIHSVYIVANPDKLAHLQPDG